MKYVSYYRANIYVIKNPINGYQSISDNTDFIFIIIIRLNIDVFLHKKKKDYTSYKDLIIIVIRIHI